MQISDLEETPATPSHPDADSENTANDKNPSLKNNEMGNSKGTSFDDESEILDISGKVLELTVPDSLKDGIKEVYFYRNVFNLIPRSIGGLGKVRAFKFFANDVNVFPEEFENLKELRSLQLKVAAPGFGNLRLGKFESLKELELCQVPPRASALSLLSEISGISGLTSLSVCHFAIKFLPPEIRCLTNLEHLDLSFNKLRKLPEEIGMLEALKSLKIANNKLVEVPSSLSSLHNLEILDLSNNRLSSLCSLKLDLMPNLQTLNLQCNKLLHCCNIPSWVYCNLEGNIMHNSDNFSVEMDVVDEVIIDIVREGSPDASSCVSTSSSLIRRPFATKRPHMEKKYLKHKYSHSRVPGRSQMKAEDQSKKIIKPAKKCNSNAVLPQGSDTVIVDESDSLCLDNTSKDTVEGEYHCRDLDGEATDNHSSPNSRLIVDKASSAANSVSGNEIENELTNHASRSLCDGSSELLTQVSGVSKLKSKRNSNASLDNLKPCKRQNTDHNSNSSLAWKFSSDSFCGMEDHLADGFYDAGRDRPFMPLEEYEKMIDPKSREVILVDRDKDTELHEILQLARASVFRLKQSTRSVNCNDQDTYSNLQIVSLLALFVSDHFGGTDRETLLERSQKNVFNSDYNKPFVCTCATGSSICGRSNKRPSSTVEDVHFNDICDKSLQSIKRRRNSVVVPLGTLRFGVCRHRALLMKYLCDRMDPPVSCELVRGYLDFMRHAWNVILVKKEDKWVRMLVDACRPHDIREERDPEYFARYTPLSRNNTSEMMRIGSTVLPELSSLPERKEVESMASHMILRCKVGSLEAVAKVRTLEVCGPFNDTSNFEYKCLGEVRILGTLKHPCIVDSYGHQISSKWILSGDESSHRRILQSAIFLEYIEGGSLKKYLDRLASADEVHVPVDIALWVARDVACGLTELHSKHIIHRDIKSENILIDLASRKADGSPVVKLCDFDMAVPLRSMMHTCCIAHTGIPPPDTCVGTPRWMAPEVLHAMHERNIYGQEADIWSYGCMLYEMLTLQDPYSGLSESTIHDLIQTGQRPELPVHIQKLLRTPEENPSMDHSDSTSPKESDTPEKVTLKFLVDLFQQCTRKNPADRPVSSDIHEMLLSHIKTRAKPSKN